MSSQPADPRSRPASQLRACTLALAMINNDMRTYMRTLKEINAADDGTGVVAELTAYWSRALVEMRGEADARQLLADTAAAAADVLRLLE